MILLLDHQTGLFQTVKDIRVAELRTNIIMLAKLATLLKIPVIYDRFGAERAERPADAGDRSSALRTPSSCRARAR